MILLLIIVLLKNTLTGQIVSQLGEMNRNFRVKFKNRIRLVLFI